MKIDLSKIDPSYSALMQNRGAPDMTRYIPINLDDKLVLPARYENRTIPVRMQLGKLQKLVANPFDYPTCTIVGSKHDTDLATIVALHIMHQTMRVFYSNVGMHRQPLMWPVFGGKRDNLRDLEDFRTSLGGVGMLLITNIAENSTPDKLEKVVDLVQMYSNIPRVVVVAGMDPLEFGLSKLHTPPNSVLHLSRGAIRKKREV